MEEEEEGGRDGLGLLLPERLEALPARDPPPSGAQRRGPVQSAARELGARELLAPRVVVSLVAAASGGAGLALLPRAICACACHALEPDGTGICDGTGI